MAMFTTSSGIEYHVDRSGGFAYPKKGPPIFPADLWDADCAAARGELVDARVPRDDYRFRAAGKDWLEVYEHLKTHDPEA